MDDTTPDPVAARLREIGARAANVYANSPGHSLTPSRMKASAADVPALLGVVEAVLARHQPGRVVILGRLCGRHAEYRHFSISSTEAADVAACAACPATVVTICAGCGRPTPLDQCPDRLDITRHLLGKEGTEDE